MKKLILCDWNRTLFDPELKRLYLDTRSFLNALKETKLVLVSRMEADSENYMQKFGLTKYFSEVLTGPKIESVFLDIRKKYPAQNYWVVGDKVDSEIALGNECGYQTIRIKRGKFKDQISSKSSEIPDYEVNTLSEALQILLSS